MSSSKQYNLVSYYLLIGYCILPVSQASHVFGHKIFTGLSEQSAARHQDLASKQKGFNVGFGLIAAVRPCGVSVIFCAKHKSIRKLQYAVKFFYWKNSIKKHQNPSITYRSGTSCISVYNTFELFSLNNEHVHTKAARQCIEYLKWYSSLAQLRFH